MANNPALQSHQIFHIAQKVLSKSEMHQIFGKTTRYMQMWAADPRYCEETRRNPLDQARLFFDALDDHGRRDVAAAALEYMAGDIGVTVRFEGRAKSDKQSVDGEIADLTVAMGNLASEIRAARADGVITTAEMIRIKKAMSDMISEYDQLLDAAGIVNRNV